MASLPTPFAKAAAGNLRASPRSPSEETRKTIPDPNDHATFERSRPVAGEGAAEMRALYAELLRLRHSLVVPRLDGARALGAEVIGPRAVVARWTMGDGAQS